MKAFLRNLRAKARWLQSLGSGYGDGFQRTGAIADLDTASKRYQEALDITPKDHPDMARRLDNLGIRYRNKFQRTKAMTNLDTTI